MTSTSCEWCEYELYDGDDGPFCSDCQVVELQPQCGCLLDPKTGEVLDTRYLGRHTPARDCEHIDRTVTVERRPAELRGENPPDWPDWACPRCGGSQPSWIDVRWIDLHEGRQS
jgi:hypothetical protein